MMSVAVNSQEEPGKFAGKTQDIRVQAPYNSRQLWSQTQNKWLTSIRVSVSPAVSSARPRDLLCNGFEQLTVIIGTDPVLQFVHMQLPIRFGNGPLAMD